MADNINKANLAWINTDPMTGEYTGDRGKAVFPTFAGMQGFEGMTADVYVKGYEELFKALPPPPNMLSFINISTMPDQFGGISIQQWPGIPPESLRKMARENIGPQLIIYTRVGDAVRYSKLSDKPWTPGWRIEPLVPLEQMSEEMRKEELKNIREAERFILNCNIETSFSKSRDRDDQGYTDFTRFLAMLVRDTLTFDGIAIFTDMDKGGKVRAFNCLPASQIRLVFESQVDREKDPEKWNEKFIGQPQSWDQSFGNWFPEDKIQQMAASPPGKIFAVGVDEAGNIKRGFTRDELIWYTRNPRSDNDWGDYGTSEMAEAVKIVQGFQNAFDLNNSIFDKSSIPNGILLLRGNVWTERQLDVLSRIWGNLKRGVSKSWALPVINVPNDSDIEILNLQEIKGMEAFYQDYINMTVGVLCTYYQMPPARLGYRISGKGPDSQMPSEVMQNPVAVDDYDNGKIVLLTHIENVINEYILSSRWPSLRFMFTGKTPSEDSREYQARMLSMTVDEKRAVTNLPPLEHLASDETEKKILSVLGKAPTDPALVGVYQALVTAFYGKQTDEKVGPAMTEDGDPAKKEGHGHTAGVRRNSKKERESAGGRNE